MDKKNPIDPITPPSSGNNGPIFNNQTPEPHPEQGNPDAFSNKNKNFDDIAARILEEAPPMSSANNAQTTEQPSIANPDLGQTMYPGQTENIPPTSVHVGGGMGKFLNWKVITVGIVGILLLTIGGVSAFKGDFYWIRDLVGMGIPSDPQKAIKRAESNTAKLESYKTNLEMGISGNIEETEFKVSTNIDISEKPKDKKAQIKLNSINLDIPKEMTAGTDIGEINSAMAGVEAISDNNTVYVKVPSVNESWYEIDQSSIEGIQELNNFIPAAFSKETENKENPLTAAVVYAATSGEEKSNIYNYLTKIKKVKDEKVDGKSAYHYQAEIDIVKAMGGTAGMPSEYGEFVNKYLKSTVDIWVTKKEMVFAKMSLSFNIDMDLSDFGATGKMKFSINLDMKMSDFNKDLTITIPTDAKKFDEKIFQDMIEGKSVDVADSRNVQRKSDMELLKTALEAYYADNNSYPITTADSKNGDFITELLDDKYLASAIKDPSHPNYYYSYTSTDGKSYTLTYVEETDSGIKVQKITN
jgi:hypothetical protein